MNLTRVFISLCFVLLLGVPLAFRPTQSQRSHAADALELIIITPHNEQIRYEFAQAFDRWHQTHFGQPVNVIYNVPGGTSEIRKMLEAQHKAAFAEGKQPGGYADLVFGGGSFEHGRLKRGVLIRDGGGERWEPISAPVDLGDAWLADRYGENRIVDDPLYDPDKHWFGLALSSFGIVYNRDALQALELDPLRRWAALCNPKLRGWVALVNPGQSGSITTAFEAILKQSGWRDGWRILRRAGANARYFSASALKPPIDVSQGNAALGMCIDFYGRFQSQALKDAGDADRVGYVDPQDGTMPDSDPISMLRGAPHPELARRFIEFCLSDEGQALWQFPRRSVDPAGDELGPERFELRRLPILRSMYQRHFDRFIDQVDPYALATPFAFPDSNYRDFIAPMFAAMVMDSHHELKRAWHAIVSHPAYAAAEQSAGGEMVTEAHTSDPTLRRMLALFDAMPSIDGPDRTALDLTTAEHLADVRGGWLRGGWAEHGLWHPEAGPIDTMRRRFGEFFRGNYRQIVQLADE